NDEVAMVRWQEIGFTEYDLITYARNNKTGDPGDALRWYRSAAQIGPDNPMLWLDVGRICQQQEEKDSICNQFLDYNDQNWLVDPYLQFGRVAWRFNRKEGVSYDIVDCPGLAEKRCARLSIGEDVP